MIDWNAALTGVALVAAIVSPVITTILTNRFQLKLIDRELLDQRKLDVINGYLEAASGSAYVTGVQEDFQRYRALILLYAPKELHDKIKTLNKAIECTSFSDETSALLYDVAEALRAENKIS